MVSAAEAKQLLQQFGVNVGVHLSKDSQFHAQMLAQGAAERQYTTLWMISTQTQNAPHKPDLAHTGRDAAKGCFYGVGEAGVFAATAAARSSSFCFRVACNAASFTGSVPAAASAAASP